MEAGKSRCGEIPRGVLTWESGMAFGAPVDEPEIY